MGEERQRKMMERTASTITQWIGSSTSVILHTILFLISFTLPYLGVVSFERMLLVLTTIVSLEAIYLSIFIQMSINMNNQSIEIIQEDIEELGEDIEELGEDIEEIGEDIEEMQKDVEELGEDIEEIGEDIEEMQKDVDEIQEEVEEISGDIEEMQKDVDEIFDEIQEEDEAETQEGIEEVQETEDNQVNREKETEILLSIQATLAHLQKEIEQLKRPGI